MDDQEQVMFWLIQNIKNGFFLSSFKTSTCSYDKFETKSVDMSSEDEYQHSSCYSELIPIDTRKLWLDIAQIIKSIYRDNQSTYNIAENIYLTVIFEFRNSIGKWTFKNQRIYSNVDFILLVDYFSHLIRIEID